MISLYKNTKYFFFLAAPLAVLAVALYTLYPYLIDPSLAFSFGNLLKPLVLAGALVLLIYYFAIRKAMKQYSATLNIFFEDCDAEGFLEAYTPIYERGKNIRFQMQIRSNYALGLYYCGKCEEAIAELEGYAESEHFQKQRKSDKVDLYVDLAIYALGCRSVEEARGYYGKALEHLSGISQEGHGFSEYGRCSRAVERLGYRIEIREGKTEEALFYFEHAGKDCKSRFAKVHRIYSMSEIYHVIGNERAEWKALRFLVENGGNTLLAKIAKERLSHLPEYDGAVAEEDFNAVSELEDGVETDGENGAEEMETEEEEKEA